MLYFCEYLCRVRAHPISTLAAECLPYLALTVAVCYNPHVPRPPRIRGWHEQFTGQRTPLLSHPDHLAGWRAGRVRVCRRYLACLNRGRRRRAPDRPPSRPLVAALVARWRAARI